VKAAYETAQRSQMVAEGVKAIASFYSGNACKF